MDFEVERITSQSHSKQKRSERQPVADHEFSAEKQKVRLNPPLTCRKTLHCRIRQDLAEKDFRRKIFDSIRVFTTNVLIGTRLAVYLVTEISQQHQLWIMDDLEPVVVTRASAYLIK